MSPLKLALQIANIKENHSLIEFILENVDPKSVVEFSWEWNPKFHLHLKQLFSPIHIAAYFGYTDVVIKLIPKYDNPNAPALGSNNANATPIHMAARNGHLDIVDALTVSVKNPIILMHSGDTPIHFAAIGGHCEIVESLKPFTDNLNTPNNNGDTPSKYAKENGHLNLSYFLKTGSHPNLLKRIRNFFEVVLVVLYVVLVQDACL